MRNRDAVTDQAIKRSVRAALFAVLLSACQPPAAADPLPPLRAESEHFRFYADDPSAFCDASIAGHERHYEALSAWLGAALPEGEKIDVYRQDEAGLLAWCGSRVRGCAIGESVHTRSDARRLLVQAYLHRVGEPPSLFREGLAEVLGSEVTSHEPVGGTPEIVTFIESATFDEPPIDPGVANLYAASFVRSLIDRHGAEAFMRFYASMAHDALLADIDAAFVAELGENLDAAVQRWIAEPPVTREGFALRIAECALPALDSEMPLSCGPTMLLRDLSSDAAAQARVPVPIGGAAVRYHASGTILMHFGTCPSSAAPATDLTFVARRGNGEVFWDGPPGDSWVYAGAVSDDPTDYSIAPGRVGPLVGDSCSDAPVHPIASDTNRITVHGPLDGRRDDEPMDGLTDVVVRFTVDAPRTLEITTSLESRRADRVSLCTDDCASCYVNYVGGGIVISGLVEPGHTYAVIVAGMLDESGYSVDLLFDP